MYFRARPTHPIEILQWEHEIFLRRLQKIEESPDQVYRMMNIIKDLEEHQEAEDRFVFPLVSDYHDGLSNLLRKQHRDISNSSDTLLALFKDQVHEEIVRFLKTFKEQLTMHFETEKIEVFDKAMATLNEAQIDVLRIKFATRRIHIM